MIMKQTFANFDVLEFYKVLPFNYKGSLDDEINAIRNMRSDKLYPSLPQLITSNTSVLDVGCGVGWLSNSISFLYNSPVTGIDFNPVAIERAREVAKALKLNTKFLVEDLFLYEPKVLFDIVISFGVLHHSNNCEFGIRHICEKFVHPGGSVVIGLYHKYGRAPFLEHFNEMKKNGATEEQMLSRFKQLHSGIKNEMQLISWFRDQVLSPHETQHTMEEILPILEKANMDLVSTSINHFQPIRSIKKLIREEKGYRELAMHYLKKKKYFPGFFIFLAQKML